MKNAYLLPFVFIFTATIEAEESRSIPFRNYPVEDYVVAQIRPETEGSIRLDIYTDRPTRTEAVYFVAPYPELTYQSGKPIYDTERRLLETRIVFNPLPKDVVDNLKSHLRKAYGMSELQEISFVEMLPIGYQVALRRGQVEDIILIQPTGNDAWNGSISLSVVIQNEKIHEGLANNPDSVSVVFSPVFKFRSTELVQCEASVKSYIQRFINEQVSGKGELLYLTREAANRLKSRAKSEINIYRSDNASSESKKRLDDFVDRYFENLLQPVPSSELNNGLVYYDTNAREEIRPITFQKCTNEKSTIKKDYNNNSDVMRDQKITDKATSNFQSKQEGDSRSGSEQKYDREKLGNDSATEETEDQTIDEAEEQAAAGGTEHENTLHQANSVSWTQGTSVNNTKKDYQQIDSTKNSQRLSDNYSEEHFQGSEEIDKVAPKTLDVRRIVIADLFRETSYRDTVERELAIVTKTIHFNLEIRSTRERFTFENLHIRQQEFEQKYAKFWDESVDTLNSGLDDLRAEIWCIYFKANGITAPLPKGRPGTGKEWIKR